MENLLSVQNVRERGAAVAKRTICICIILIFLIQIPGFTEGQGSSRITVNSYQEFYDSANEIANMQHVYNHQDFYSALNEALQGFEDRLIVKVYNYNEQDYDISGTVEEVQSNNPDADYGYKGAVSTRYGDGRDKVIEICLKYYFPKDVMTGMRTETVNKAVQVIGEIIRPDMKDYEKELAIHDYIVNNTKYDEENVRKGTVPPESYTAYGVLVKGRGVCEGYSRAMKKLLDMVNIESEIVSGLGRGRGHAWNIVKIGGEYYHTDVTWDDPVTVDGRNVLGHDYFNLTDERMSIEHTWDRNMYPKCDSTTYSYDNIISGKCEQVPEGKPAQPIPASTDITVTVNGKVLDFDVKPQVVNERVLVPIRAILESLRAIVLWDRFTNSIICNKGHTSIKLTIGSKIATVDGRQVELDVPTIAVGNRTLVPARFIAESLGAAVDWDGSTRTVIIKCDW